MKILIQSCLFSPSVGGTETATRLLAIGLSELGHQVKVVTDIKGESPYTMDFPVYRCIPASELLNLVRWCDVFIHCNISLRHAWPLLIHRRPWVIIHHTRLEPNGQRTMVSRVKQWMTRFATNVVVSKFMADNLRSPSIVLKNPYSDDIFQVQTGAVRTRDLIVVGRLNEDKGFQVAIEALHRLHQRGYAKLRMTIVGEGPYHEELLALTKKRGLQNAVEFTGIKLSEELVHFFHRHAILIVPSLTLETFGLVAVEGMASGCFVVGSDVGGLKETIGPGGQTFKAGDVEALTNLLQEHLDHPETMEPYAKAASSHLAQFERAVIIPSYADCIQQALLHWKGRA